MTTDENGSDMPPIEAPDRLSPHPGGLGYRAALDGLRGVAIALVMVRHLSLAVGVGGGAVGVGMFFALSGFLITTLLIEERDRTGTVAVVRFWMRRACRLLPALAVVLAAVVLWFRVVADQDWGGAALFTALYAGNWAQIGGRSFGPIAHTWTLAVEEHFYVLWPVAFLALSRLTRIRAARSMLLMAGASSFLRLGLWAGGARPIRLQMGTDTRLDGILLGCAVALLGIGRCPTISLRVAGAAASVLTVLVAVQPYSTFMLIAGYTVIPLATLAVILHVVSAESPLRRALQCRPLVALGRVSYGLYLWHFPIYVVLLPRTTGLPVVVRSAIVIGTSLAIAAVSFLLVERPFLRLKATRWSRPAGPVGPPLSSP